MRGHLVDECIATRVGKNPRKPKTSRTEVAAKIKQGEQTVARFEQGTGKWHKRTGELVAAYAELAGVEPIALWRAAIDRWAAAQAEAPGAVSEVPAMESVRETRPSSKTNRAKGSRAAG